MTSPRNDAADIAWMKTLAEEGAKSPPHGGSILFAAGLIFGMASLAHWTVITGLIDVGPAAYGIVWGAAALAFVGALVVLIRRLQAQGGVETAANRAFGIVWAALGWGMFSLFTSLALLKIGQVGDLQPAQWSLAVPSIILAFYGVGWAVSASMLRQRMLWILSIATFAGAPALAVLSGSEHQYLAYAAALFLLMAMPGYLLMRAAKRG